MHSEYSGIKTTQELATHVLPPLKFCRCAPEKGVPAQNQLDGWEDVEGVVHHQGLSYVPEIIRIELTSHFGIENSRTCCQKILAVAATETTRAGLPMFTDRKNTSYDSILLIVGLHDQPVQIRIDASRLPRLDRQQLRLSLHL